ncbi:MAG: hypothetical protein OEV44_08335 [Spirochaetota bacterium]|nr:hypothetical protein [Spirochaetota bacterium]
MRLLSYSILTLLFVIVNVSYGKADYTFKDGKKIYLLSRVEGKKAILNDEILPFFNVLNNLDMSIRMGIQLDPSKLNESRSRFKEFVQDSVMDWTLEEKKALLRVLNLCYYICNSAVPGFIPTKWRFIKTSGKEDSGFFYTRGDCIIVPQNELDKLLKDKKYIKTFIEVIIHETFHVYSKLNQDKRKLLYEIIGFKKDLEVELGSFLLERKLTNPDGSDYSYRITIQNHNGLKMQAIIMILSKYDSYQKGNNNVLNYLTVSLFEVSLQNGKWKVVLDKNGAVKPIDPNKAKGFYEQIGRNTGYIIHPDEILADNVMIYFLWKNGLKNVKEIDDTKLLERIEKVLKSK